MTSTADCAGREIEEHLPYQPALNRCDVQRLQLVSLRSRFAP
jgi:hypothetical protein